MAATSLIVVLTALAGVTLVAVLLRRLPQPALPACCLVLFGELMLLVQVAQHRWIWQTALSGTGALIAFVALAIGVLTQESQLSVRWWRRFEADLVRFREDSDALGG